MSQNIDDQISDKKLTQDSDHEEKLTAGVIPLDEDSEEEVITLNADQGAAAADEFNDDGQESEEQQQKQAEHERSMRRPTNAREVLTQFIPNRSERTDEKLRAHLVGKISVRIEGTSEEYLFELNKGRAQVQEISSPSADCTIRVSEANLMRLVAGELNPQIAMLSGKVKIEGKAELAIYFFNLVAPRNH
jgi:putative sterol carrier protein